MFSKLLRFLGYHMESLKIFYILAIPRKIKSEVFFPKGSTRPKLISKTSIGVCPMTKEISEIRPLEREPNGYVKSPGGGDFHGKVIGMLVVFLRV